MIHRFRTSFRLKKGVNEYPRKPGTVLAAYVDNNHVNIPLRICTIDEWVLEPANVRLGVGLPAIAVCLWGSITRGSITIWPAPDRDDLWLRVIYEDGERQAVDLSPRGERLVLALEEAKMRIQREIVGGG